MPDSTSRGDRSLPNLSAVRPRATDDDGDPVVEIRFSNGARVRYRSIADGIREEWLAPDADEPTRAHTVDVPPARGDGAAESTSESGPSTRELADRALCAISSYLSFGGRRRAEFTWGEANVAVLADEAGAKPDPRTETD